MPDCRHIEHVGLNEKKETEKKRKRKIHVYAGGTYLSSYVDAKVQIASPVHIQIITAEGECVDVYNGTVVEEDYYRKSDQ